MIWEGQSSLIIMLTTIVERGRIKCHNYWPEVGETVEYGRLSVTCTREDSRENFVFRDFSIRHLDKVKMRKHSGDSGEISGDDDDEEEVRHVTQMAYLSWPDHGVPENHDEFIQFVETVRLHRQGSIYPTIVHCSAGIGRTGVLILMETALYLIEANQPVYPLDLTRIMRDQRASMIQTPSQYKFVCQAILKVFREGQVKPLPEFCHST
jgi:tyrosine-protein phosphatase non-receptor type 4